MGTKYDYPAGMTDAEKKRARREARVIAKANGTYVPHSANTDGARMLLTPAMAQIAGNGRTAGNGSVKTPASTSAVTYAVNDVQSFMLLLAAGGNASAIARVTRPEVLAQYRQLAGLFLAVHEGQNEQEDEQEDEQEEGQNEQEEGQQ